MAESMNNEVKEIYAKARSSCKDRLSTLRKEVNINMDLKKNESYTEIETK